MQQYRWTPAMSVGSPVVDSDHRMLVDLINRVQGAAEAGEPDAIGEVLDGLIAYVEFHFSREEKMMAAAGFAELKAHAAEHTSFTDHVYQLRREFELDATAIDAAALFEYLKTWLNHHILIQDMAYRPLVEGNEAVEAVGRQFGAGLSELGREVGGD